MPAAYLRDYKISERAAAVAREILSKPDHNTTEWGAVLYELPSGEIVSTTLAHGQPYGGGMSFDMSGSSDATIVGIIHNHLEVFYNPGPDPNNGQGQYQIYGYDKNDRDKDSLGGHVAWSLGQC